MDKNNISLPLAGNNKKSFSCTGYVKHKNSMECDVEPALCLHIKNSMKASVWHIFWQNPSGSSWDIVYFIFSLFLVTADAAILDGQPVKKSDINLKQLHLQIILIERD